MVKSRLVLVIALLSSACALGHADVKFTQSGQFTGAASGPFSTETTLTTTYVKGPWLRIDLPDGTYGIIDLGASRESVVDPSKRTYSTITFGEIRAQRAALEQRASQFAIHPTNPPHKAELVPKMTWVPTGKTQVLLGQTARELELEADPHSPSAGNGSYESAGMKMRWWVAPAASGFEEVRDFYRKLAAAIAWTPSVPGSKGMAELLEAEGCQQREQPVWIPVLTKAFFDLGSVRGAAEGLPLLQELQITPSFGRGQSAATKAVPTVGWAVRVTSYSAQPLDASLFTIPKNYVELKLNVGDMWTAAISQ